MLRRRGAGQGLLLLLALVAAPGRAAEPILDARTVVAEVERNQRALHGYRWKSRVEVALAGEVREVTLFEARFAEDGAVVRTRTGEEPVAASSGKRERKKIAEAVQGVEALSRSYLEAGPEWMRKSFERARVTRGTAGGLTLLQARDALRSGDTMKILVDDLTLQPRRFEVLTSLEGEPVQLRAEFAEGEDGPAYLVRVVVETEIKEDPLTVTTVNSDYTKR